jgi:hypothetical protein
MNSATVSIRNIFNRLSHNAVLWPQILCPCNKRNFFFNYIFNIPKKSTYSIKHTIINTSTCFGNYCTIFREKFIVSSKILLCFVTACIKMYYTWFYNVNYDYLKTIIKKKKVKVTLVQALRLCTGRMPYRGSRGIALPFLDHGTRRGEGSESRTGRCLPPGDTRYPL